MLLHFLNLDIFSHSVDINPLLETLYVQNDMTAIFPGREARLGVALEFADSLQRLRLELPTTSVPIEVHLCCAPGYFGDGIFFSVAKPPYEHVMTYDPRSRTLSANISRNYEKEPQAIITNIIRPLLRSFLMPFFGLKTLHGALLTDGNRTFFFNGPSGAGKTALAIHLMQSGFDLLSDDSPFFLLENGEALALSSLDYLHVTEDILNLFPQLKLNIVGERDSAEKFAVPYLRRNGSAAWRRPQKVTDFVILNRCNVHRPLLLERKRNDALRHLLDESMLVFRKQLFDRSPDLSMNYSGFIMEIVATMLENARCHELRYANEHLPLLAPLLNSAPL